MPQLRLLRHCGRPRPCRRAPFHCRRHGYRDQPHPGFPSSSPRGRHPPCHLSLRPPDHRFRSQRVQPYRLARQRESPIETPVLVGGGIAIGAGQANEDVLYLRARGRNNLSGKHGQADHVEVGPRGGFRVGHHAPLGGRARLIIGGELFPQCSCSPLREGSVVSKSLTLATRPPL